MPKINDILSDLQITREELAVAYKKVVGKALSSRAVNLKDEEWPLIEKELGSSAKKAATKDSKKDDDKVLKGDELFSGDDFLS